MEQKLTIHQSFSLIKNQRTKAGNILINDIKSTSLGSSHGECLFAISKGTQRVVFRGRVISEVELRKEKQNSLKELGIEFVQRFVHYERQTSDKKSTRPSSSFRTSSTSNP